MGLYMFFLLGRAPNSYTLLLDRVICTQLLYAGSATGTSDFYLPRFLVLNKVKLCEV
jgi:hypothetical protein